MLLTSARVISFKSIEDSGVVSIDPYVTALVGQNESGKTAFLQALHKARAVDVDVDYEIIEDYPRKDLNNYERRHEKDPAVVAELTYEFQENEINAINQELGFELQEGFTFTLHHKYDGTLIVSVRIPEKPYVDNKLKNATLPSEIIQKVSKAENINQLISMLEALDLNIEATNFLETLKEKFVPTPQTWKNSTLSYYIYKLYISPKVPRFLYFDDYYLLPGKINLPSLQQRVIDQVTQNEDKTALRLLTMAGVDLGDLTDISGYEKVKAKLEAISNSITDKVFKYWTQNQDLDVEFDIRPDPQDQAPYNNGNNLYIRIRNRRHRVSVPFSQRSKGFIWFFSFIVWFDSIKQELGNNSDLVLLLDEPGLSLHALAQVDFLKYIDELTKDHQIIYTTHSPFMVHSDRLYQVRTVEDKLGEGTKISENISSSDPKTLFPLQAALGYTIAQNLFISKQNLLVEGPADLIYLKFFSMTLHKLNRISLQDGITIVPVGGLDKLATFVALLRGNELELGVLHDFESKPDARLESLVREKLIRDRQILHYAMFRNGRKAVKKSSIPPTSSDFVSSDVEDLISLDLYIKLFNSAYKKELRGTEISATDLPPGDRIVNRISRYLEANSIQLKPSGGYNHYLIANYLVSNPIPPGKIDAATLNQFEHLFQSVNSMYSS